MVQVIFQRPLSALTDVVLDIAPKATTERYRLIDCRQYTIARVLSIAECIDISSISYAAVSYVWKGNTSSEQGKTASFSVKGAEDGDPVSIDALYQACLASLLEGANWLWLDRLCIVQTSSDDKAWQIGHMYNIYQLCKVSIVLPGGISRLVPVDEETGWITRAWTLQEVTAPPRAVVLFAWECGAGEWKDERGEVIGRVTEVSSGTALVPLQDVLKACFHPVALEWTATGKPDSCDDVSPCILGTYGESSIGSLLWALEVDDADGKSMAIWRSSLLRASSRPVDMVFSIMGTFNVVLDPKRFHKNDRVGATIALAQEILRLGGKPVWLALSLDIPPSRFISSFPDFPATSITGDVRWETRHRPLNPTVADDIYDIDELNDTSSGSEEVRGEDASNVFFDEYWVPDIPHGSMDDDGYLMIRAKAVPALFTGQVLGRRRTVLAKNNDGTLPFEDIPEDTIRVAATDGKIWDLLPTETDAANALPNAMSRTSYIVFIGVSQKFPRVPVLQPDPRPIGGITLPDMSRLRAFALERHAEGKFHRTSTFTFDQATFQPIIDGWEERTFAIGGPEPLPPGTHRGPAIISLAGSRSDAEDVSHKRSKGLGWLCRVLLPCMKSSKNVN